MSQNKMTQADASRIQAATAKNTSGGVSKNSFAARAQAAGAKNQSAGKGAGKK